jgi:hypothetical protein
MQLRMQSKHQRQEIRFTPRLNPLDERIDPAAEIAFHPLQLSAVPLAVKSDTFLIEPVLWHAEAYVVRVEHHSSFPITQQPRFPHRPMQFYIENKAKTMHRFYMTSEHDESQKDLI